MKEYKHEEWMKMIKELNSNQPDLMDLVNEQIRSYEEEKNHYEQAALQYAEKHGIIEYSITDNTMTYFESYPSEGTFKATVNLDTLKESRSQVK
jgi:hypothetical protein